MTVLRAFCQFAVFAWAACLNAQQDCPKVSQFPIELARNFRNLVREDNLAPLLAGTTATAVARVPEHDVAEFFLHTRRLHELGDAGALIGGPIVSAGGITGLFLAGRVSQNQSFQKLTYSLAQATAMSMALAGIVKPAVRRARPDLDNRRSFYSGHTSNAFAWAAVISRGHGVEISIPSYAVAVLIGASRLEMNKHYLTDVTVGATVGYLIGRSVSRPRHPGSSRRFGWEITPLPDGLGFAICYRISG